MHFSNKIIKQIFLNFSRLTQYLKNRWLKTLENNFQVNNEKRIRTLTIPIAINYFSFLFQLHVPVQLPCYDFIQIINLSMGLVKTFKRNWFFASDGRYVQGQVTYSPQRADLRLLVIPTWCRRVAIYNPNWENFYWLTQNFFFVYFL